MSQNNLSVAFENVEVSAQLMHDATSKLEELHKANCAQVRAIRQASSLDDMIAAWTKLHESDLLAEIENAARELTAQTSGLVEDLNKTTKVVKETFDKHEKAIKELREKIEEGDSWRDSE